MRDLFSCGAEHNKVSPITSCRRSKVTTQRRRRGENGIKCSPANKTGRTIRPALLVGTAVSLGIYRGVPTHVLEIPRLYTTGGDGVGLDSTCLQVHNWKDSSKPSKGAPYQEPGTCGGAGVCVCACDHLYLKDEG